MSFYCIDNDKDEEFFFLRHIGEIVLFLFLQWSNRVLSFCLHTILDFVRNERVSLIDYTINQ